MKHTDKSWDIIYQLESRYISKYHFFLVPAGEGPAGYDFRHNEEVDLAASGKYSSVSSNEYKSWKKSHEISSSICLFFKRIW